MHERSLRIVYNDYESLFQDLLELNNSVSNHHRNIHLLAIEVFKIKNGFSNQIMSESFDLQNIEYNLRSRTNSSLLALYTADYSLQSLRIFHSKSLEYDTRGY